MRIKKHSNRNEYALTKEGIWVRNLTKKNTPYIDINGLAKEHFQLLLKNELENSKNRHPYFEIKSQYYPKILIISDGYGFSAKQEFLASLPKEVIIIAVNRSLANWELVGDSATKKRAINYYVVNNPFEECCRFLPKKHRYFPKCIASNRTNINFLEKYKGEKYLYEPAHDDFYKTSLANENYKIDDYRNPICAAISLAYNFQVEKLALLCCDDSFDKKMANSVKLENDLYCYSQQIMSQNIMDNMFYWLRTQDIDIRDCSSGIKYKNAPYINLNDLNNFFKD